MSGESNDSDILAKLMICFIGAASAAVVITIYHCIATRDIRVLLRCGIIIRRRQAAPPSSASAQQHEYQSSVENSMAELIPAHKYQKGRENDGVCAVCLSEFEDGEELRTLPECMHSFHVACIDMWLYSHTNCPVCRTEATPPSPHVIVHVPAPAPSRPARLTNTMPMFISGVIQ